MGSISLHKIVNAQIPVVGFTWGPIIVCPLFNQIRAVWHVRAIISRHRYRQFDETVSLSFFFFFFLFPARRLYILLITWSKNCVIQLFPWMLLYIISSRIFHGVHWLRFRICISQNIRPPEVHPCACKRHILEEKEWESWRRQASPGLSWILGFSRYRFRGSTALLCALVSVKVQCISIRSKASFQSIIH